MVGIFFAFCLFVQNIPHLTRTHTQKASQTRSRFNIKIKCSTRHKSDDKSRLAGFEECEKSNLISQIVITTTRPTHTHSARKIIWSTKIHFWWGTFFSLFLESCVNSHKKFAHTISSGSINRRGWFIKFIVCLISFFFLQHLVCFCRGSQQLGWWDDVARRIKRKK